MTVIDLGRRRRLAATQAFVDDARRLLASDDEARRRQLEDRLLALLPQLRAAGVLDVFQVRDPALRRMLEDCDTAAEPSRHGLTG